MSGLRFCAESGCPNRVPRGRCAQHARPSASQRGYTTQWEYFRNVTFPTLLVEQNIFLPTCGARLAPGPHPWSECAKAGTDVPGVPLELDHEPPLQDWERKVPSIVCDPHRVGYLCKACHSKKTRMEGQPRMVPTGKAPLVSHWATGTGASRYVVCGPPGVGKTTWVEQRAQPGDLVWDLDKVADTIAMSPTFPRPPLVLEALLTMQRALLQWLSTERQATAYIVIANEQDAQKVCQQIGAELVRLQPATQ